MYVFKIQGVGATRLKTENPGKIKDIQYFKADWFEDQDVLDIGCNIGPIPCPSVSESTSNVFNENQETWEGTGHGAPAGYCGFCRHL